MQLTIRGLPPEVEDDIRREARKGRISLNKAVIQLLERALGRSRSDEPVDLHHDLDRFSGAWSPEEASELDKRFGQTRTVDEELWK